MTFDEFDAAAKALPGVTFDIKWGKDRVYSVGDKMFAVAGQLGEEAPRWCMKVSDASFEQLCEEGVAEPAPYMARNKWVLFASADAIPADQLKGYLVNAHALIAAKLSKKAQRELGML
ncbi:MmcQ/YjbR family DNA-binding protein [Caulobacter sp. 17J65-9]|uniref:MmcQ/YjbR family DNA-binding protein n=1 Tax=Caulobacter sp. 17J65-9 TaxID=2709382 RepID=UPI0013CC553B|nr:MmcQ/YjbR family DNA-binding protein [Caulobacter sp. 17J65-9]